MKPVTVNWDHYQSFLAVIDTSSLSAAAKVLGLSQPTIGRHIDALEQAVGISLFVRSRYGLSATEAALGMVPHARSMASAASAIKRAASADGEIEGTVRLTASEVVGVEILPAIIASFNRQHAHIRIELALTNRSENLLKREADIAIRMRRPTQEALVAQKMGDVPIKLFAHESYVKARGLPESIDEVGQHLSIGPDNMRFYDEFLGVPDIETLRTAMTFKSDSDLAQLALVRAGCGIGGIQLQLAARDPELIPVLYKVFSIPMEMWLVTHEDIINARPIRLLFDHLAKHLGNYVRGESRALS